MENNVTFKFPNNNNSENGTQYITGLTTAKEGNALIKRKGRTSLLSAKVMLFSLLNVENRNEISYDLKSAKYYRQLAVETGIDYSKGIVAEMDVSDLKNLLNKKSSGSFNASLKELFSIDPHEEKSLRNSWAVMLPNPDSGVLGYAEVVTACHYDSKKGKLLMKFSEEEAVKSQIWQIKSEYTELPFLHMINIKSIHTYRLYEIIYSDISKADQALKDQGLEPATEYSFKYSVGELYFMMGILDITADSEGKKAAASRKADYNTIAADVNTRQHENMYDYKSFKRYALEAAIKEINETPTSTFTISYDVEREEGGKRIAYVEFYIKKKALGVVPNISAEPEVQKSNILDNADMIVDLARELKDIVLSFDELRRIASAANFDTKVVTAAYNLYQQLQIQEDFVSWFENLRK